MPSHQVQVTFVSPHNSLQQKMKKEEIFCWFETMVNSVNFIFYFVKICDSYKVWKCIASCFGKNSNESKFIHCTRNIETIIQGDVPIFYLFLIH